MKPAETQTQQIPKQADITDQKTYRNEQYGFEFKYPQNFLVGKFKPEVTPSSNVPPDIQEKLSDLSSNNAIVLVESEQMALFSKSPKVLSVDSIPIGEVPTISIKPITTSADFYRRAYIEAEFFSEPKFSSDYKTKKIQIGNYQVTKLPGYPGPYGDAGYYYLLPISDNLIIEFTALKEKILTNTEMTESHYDKVIEDIISTFKLFNLSQNDIIPSQAYNITLYAYEKNGSHIFDGAVIAAIDTSIGKIIAEQTADQNGKVVFSLTSGKAYRFQPSPLRENRVVGFLNLFIPLEENKPQTLLLTEIGPSSFGAPVDTCEEKSAAINLALEQANYCETEFDCKLLQPGGFSCSVYTNQSFDSSVVLQRVSDYGKACGFTQYKCAQLSHSPSCVLGRCQMGR